MSVTKIGKITAFPHKSQNFPTLTGTYLQAWSNSEQLRIWYQHFLGIRPDMVSNTLLLAPRIPEEIKNLKYNFIIGNHLYEADYVDEANAKKFTYQLGDAPLKISIDIFPFQKKEISTVPNGILTVINNGENLQITLTDKSGKSIRHITAIKSQERINYINQYFQELDKVPFASPDDLKNHKTIKNTDQ